MLFSRTLCKGSESASRVAATGAETTLYKFVIVFRNQLISLLYTDFGTRKHYMNKKMSKGNSRYSLTTLDILCQILSVTDGWRHFFCWLLSDDVILKTPSLTLKTHVTSTICAGTQVSLWSPYLVRPCADTSDSLWWSFFNPFPRYSR